MTQASLDFTARSEQRRQLARVTGALASAILQFCRERVGQEWHASELHEAVGGAPASADRVLRGLRQAGVVKYRVTDRAASRYCVEAVK